MGCDIHGVFQRRTSDGWEDIEHRFEMNRDYQLFAVLAGVRYGYGFAGAVTGEPVKPVSAPRGFPVDFVVDGDDHPVVTPAVMNKWSEQGEALAIWMGDHSHSWLSVAEMLDWYDKAPSVVQTGVLDREAFSKWDRESPPEEYCGAVWGRDVVVIHEPEVGRTDKSWSHVQVTWDASLKKELAYFFDEARRLQDEHGEVRLVFGFDS